MQRSWSHTIWCCWFASNLRWIMLAVSKFVEQKDTHTHTKGGGRCRNLIYVAPCATHGSKSPQKVGSKLSKVRGKICFGFAELKDRLWAKNPSRNHWISTETREIYECLSKPTRGAESRLTVIARMSPRQWLKGPCLLLCSLNSLRI